ncbi:DUF4433 domain-containing protein [Candidatus Falkowbacteria bacterium CG_4_10_14_0_2_um_filter_36_22]|nr:MAG: DUF4433 domain-containing protein [Candidatus Falkowbacteria bacterium CG_4_10_14_0_2_um_filter_36_22]
MELSDIEELYFITHIDNLASILKNGILCCNKVQKIPHISIADPKVQERRDKVVPGGKSKLHDYANLYFNPRNPMMFKRRNGHDKLCILQISVLIMNELGVIITDGNAASDYTRFFTSPQGLIELDKSSIFTEFWTSDDVIQQFECKRKICAEVLVPNFISQEFIIGICLSCNNACKKVIELIKESPLVSKISIKPNLFFQGG